MNDKEIDQFIGDSQKRSFARSAMGHAAYNPCEYCTARGVLCSSKNHSKRVCWPSSTANGTPRTKAGILMIVEKIENNEPMSAEDKEGIKGRSFFLNLDDFDFVLDIPVEYLHSVCLGSVKRLVILTFAVGETRERKTKRKLSNPADFNELIANVLSPREFPRRVRDLDITVYKAAEYRNLILFFFPLVLECIEENEGERKIWLYFAYIIRACVLPTEEFSRVNLDDIHDCAARLYTLYEKLFGAVNCSYNTHCVFSHITEIRAHGPLTLTSAFGFENFYGEMRNAFVPGTASPLKQILRKILLKRVLEPHSCAAPIHFADHNTSLENNTLIYCWERNTHCVYQIKEINDQQFLCNPINTVPHVFEDIHNLDWSKVGVYKKGELQAIDVFIPKKNVCGKVLEVRGLFLTCPNNVLREK